jgi:hypothetical protein
MINRIDWPGSVEKTQPLLQCCNFFYIKQLSIYQNSTLKEFLRIFHRAGRFSQISTNFQKLSTNQPNRLNLSSGIHGNDSKTDFTGINPTRGQAGIDY